MKNTAAHRTRARPSARLGRAGRRRTRRAVLSACSSSDPPHKAAAKPPSRPRPRRPRLPRGRPCPLTGLPAPGGAVPQRPAMAVKIDNYPDGRPQAGLDKADIVFEEPVEGGITRYAAVFQCQNALAHRPRPLRPQHRHRHPRAARQPARGPRRAASTPSCEHRRLAHPNVTSARSDSLTIHPAGRVSPDADFTSTSLVYGTHPTMTTPPQPLFTYSTTLPGAGSPVSNVNIPFSGTSNVTWNWNATTNTFQRFYNGPRRTCSPTARRTRRPNVVVQYVQVELRALGRELPGRPRGPGGPLPQRQRHRDVFRNGQAIPGHLAPRRPGLPDAVRQRVRRSPSRSSRAPPGSSWCPARSPSPRRPPRLPGGIPTAHARGEATRS